MDAFAGCTDLSVVAAPSLKKEECIGGDQKNTGVKEEAFDEATDGGEDCSDGDESRFSYISTTTTQTKHEGDNADVKEEDTSDEESRFSYNPKDEPSKVEEDQSTRVLPASLPSIRQTPLIGRRQLHYLTGGKQGGYKNPLNVATPVNHCGAPAFATKGAHVVHICIKEEINHPLPKCENETCLVYRTTKGGMMARDIRLLQGYRPKYDHPSIPVFWEPKDQEKTKVRYVGHWKVVEIEDYSESHVVVKGVKRCALVKLEFDEFNERWADIIQWCQDKTDDEILSKNWDGDIGGNWGYVHQTCEGSSTGNESTRRRSKRRRIR